MKASLYVAAVGAIHISGTAAATVRLQETPCLQNSTELQSFDVTVGSLQQISLASVCGLAIVSAEGVDINAISCQAFRDAAGQSPGSAVFTVDRPALIATNPVQEEAILCQVAVGSSIGSVTGSVSATTSFEASMMTILTTGSGRLMPTGGANYTLNGTSVVSPSPTASEPSPSNVPDAAGTMDVSISAILLAISFAIFSL